MNTFVKFAAVALSALTLTSCAKQEPKQPKYVFYLILDGCGVNTVLGQEMYNAELQGTIGRVQTRMTQFSVVSVASTYSGNSGITENTTSTTGLPVAMSRSTNSS